MDLIPQKQVYIKTEPNDSFDLNNSSFLELKEELCINSQVKQEEPSTLKFEEVQIKSETLDIKASIEYKSFDIKYEKFLTEELDIKDETVVKTPDVDNVSLQSNIYKCDICDYKASGKVKLHWHKCIHSNQTVFSCNECEYKTTKEFFFKRHTIIHNKHSFKCKVCGYHASRKYSYMRHMATHSTEKLFKCTLCEYESSQKHNMQRHMLKHTGETSRMHPIEKPFKCRLCDYITSRKHHLQRHMFIHTGEKPFKCTHCSYKTAYQHTMVKHKKTHLTDEYFKCNKCDFRTRVKLNFQMHVHTRERPFKCKVCDYKATQKHYLQQHMLTHSKEKPFKCGECNYQTAYKRNIVVHKKKHLSGKFFQCTKCDYKTAVKLNFEMHIHNVQQVNTLAPAPNLNVWKRSLHDEKKSTGTGKVTFYKCSECSYKTKVKRLFDMHLPTHVKNEKEVACSSILNVCQPTPNVQQNSGVSFFKCNKCNYRTTVKRNFQMHVHSPEQTNTANFIPDHVVPTPAFQSTNMNIYHGSIATAPSAAVSAPGVNVNSGFVYVVNPLQTLNQNYYYQL